MSRPQLVTATGDILRQIYDETWPIWSDGLSREAYEKYNRAQMSTAWGFRHLSRLALLDDGRLLCSGKKYEFTLRIEGRDARVVGIGAVFTPEAMRGRGHAAAFIESLIEQAGREGAEYAFLFSEIDPGFYARLGFVPVPVAEATVTLRTQRREGAPAILMRGGDDRDLINIAAMHEARAERYAFTLRRPTEYVQHAIAKRRLLAAFGAPGVREVEYFITEEGGNAVAYVVVTHGPEGDVVEEWGDRDPTGARVGAMLQTMAARTPDAPPPAWRTWLPLDLAPPQIERRTEEPPPEHAMIRGIGRPAPAVPPEGVFYLRADAF